MARISVRRRRQAVSALAAAGLVGGVTYGLAPSQAVAPAAADEAVDCSTVAWMDTGKTPEQRATALLEASSQHQKYRWLVEQPANSPEQTDFRGVIYPVQVPCTPTVVYTDGPEGVRNVTGVTAFPGQLALASSFNDDFAYAKGLAMGREAFDKRKNVILAPGIGGGRTPLAGRTPEYFGEDPVLNGVLAAEQAAGIEGSPDKPVLATLKHYIANEQELDRELSSSNMDERTFKQIYELPYDIAVAEGDPESVMCSFNQVNGVYACESDILDESLKGDLGFGGYVMSDFGSVHSTAASLKAGLDQELNRPVWYTPELLDAALAAGEITQADIDGAALRVVASYIRGGLFDTAMPATAVEDTSTAAHKALARRIVEQGSVLLSNDGTLPLSVADGDSVAVIGATAAAEATDGVSAKTICSLPIPFGSKNTLACEDVVAPLDALRQRAGIDGADVTFDAGTDPAAAAAKAAEADVAVVFATKHIGEFVDPTDLRLDRDGDALIEAVAAANPRTVVVLETGTAVEMPWLDDVAAVLEAWYPGEQQGPAIARLLFGDVNPSGKLPMTFPVSVEQGPVTSDEQYPGVFADGSTTRPDGDETSIRQVSYSEGLQVGYRWFQAEDEEPLFEFGHGLSYTKFRYSALQAKAVGSAERPSLKLRFRLANVGRRAGSEVAQAYLRLPAAADEPWGRLIGWRRVDLAAGKARTVTMTFGPGLVERRHLMSFWSESADAWRTLPGTYRVSVGGSSDTATGTSVRLPRR